MTNDEKWKIAKWIRRNGSTTRGDAPNWFEGPLDVYEDYTFFSVEQLKTSSAGRFLESDKDLFFMSDKNMDAYRQEKLRRIHKFRDWIEPVCVVIAIAISIAALIVSIVALQQPPQL